MKRFLLEDNFCFLVGERCWYRGNWKGKRHGAVGDGVEKMAELMDSEAEELWRPGLGWNPRLGLVYGQYHGIINLKP